MNDALTGQAIGDAFGASFEYTDNAYHYALQSIREGRYLHIVKDCGGNKYRLPGLYTDDTQQAAILCWLSQHPSVDMKSPGKVGTAFIDVCQYVSHRGTGKNFRAVMKSLAPVKTAGLGAAMRVVPVATTFYTEEEAAEWAYAFSACTTSDPLGKASAAYIAAAAWRAATKEASIKPSITLPLDAWDVIASLHDVYLQQGVEACIMAANKHPGLECVQTTMTDGYGPTGVVWAIESVKEGFVESLLHACLYGGDTDTVCAMTGALWAAKNGIEGIPAWMVEQCVYIPNDITAYDPIMVEQYLSQLERKEKKHNHV